MIDGCRADVIIERQIIECVWADFDGRRFMSEE